MKNRPIQAFLLIISVISAIVGYIFHTIRGGVAWGQVIYVDFTVQAQIGYICALIFFLCFIVYTFVDLPANTKD